MKLAIIHPNFFFSASRHGSNGAGGEAFIAPFSMVGERAKHESCRVDMFNGFQKYWYMFHRTSIGYFGV